MGKFDIKNGIKLGYDDVYIVPEVSTGIESRRNCDPMTRDGMFPLWAAPMDTVVDETNWKSFFNEGINVIIPRTTPIKTRIDYLYEFGVYPCPVCGILCVRNHQVFSPGEKLLLQKDKP